MNATDVLVMSVASYFVNMYFLGGLLKECIDTYRSGMSLYCEFDIGTMSAPLTQYTEYGVLAVLLLLPQSPEMYESIMSLIL